MKIKECKTWARELLLGKYCTVVISQILFNLLLLGIALSAVLSLCTAVGGPLVSVLLWGNPESFRPNPSMARIVAGSLMFTACLFLLVILVLFKEYGFIRQMHNICRNGKADIGDIFSAFRRGSGVWTYIGVWFIMILIGTVFGLLSGFLESIFLKNYISYPVYMALIALFILADYLIMTKFYLADIVAITDPGRGILGSMKEGARLMKGRMPMGFWLAYISFFLWIILVMICPFAGLFVMPYIYVTKMVFYFDARDELWKIKGGRQRSVSGRVYGDGAYTSANDNGTHTAPNADGSRSVDDGHGAYPSVDADGAYPEASADTTHSSADADVPRPTDSCHSTPSTADADVANSEATTDADVANSEATVDATHSSADVGGSHNASDSDGACTAEDDISDVETTASGTYEAGKEKKPEGEEPLSFEDAAKAAGIDMLVGCSSGESDSDQPHHDNPD